jgi:hypothetical protein
VPACLIVGDQDSIAPPAQHAIPMYEAAAAPRRQPLIGGGWHCGFLDSSFIGCDSGSMPRETQLMLTRGLLTAFLNLYLKNDQTVWRLVWGPELYSEPSIDNARLDAGITIDPVEASVEGYGGQTVEVDVLLTNSGPLSTSYTIFVEDHTWSVTPSSTQTAMLDPGASTTQPIIVDIPEGPDAATDTALLSARSDLDDTTRGYAVLTTVRRQLGDLNGDGMVNVDDFAAFGSCLTGPDVALLSECEGADLDSDFDTDVADFAAFQLRFGATQ